MRFPASAPPVSLQRPGGHRHFWERAVSRRTFVRGTLGVAGAVAASDLLTTLTFATPGTAAPKPIPGGFTLGGVQFHVNLPGFGVENSTITDFVGHLGFADVQGTGTGTDLVTHTSEPLLFDADMRFMKGEYVGEDGGVRRGTFAFV